MVGGTAQVLRLTSRARLQGMHPAAAHLVRVALDRDAECTAQPQVCNLTAHYAVIHKQVLGLQITMHDAMFVAVRQALNQLVHKTLQVQELRP